MAALADLPRYDLPDGQVAIGAHASKNGHVVFTSRRASEHREAAPDYAPWLASRLTTGGLLIGGACILLASLAVAMGITSFHAQFAYILATKHQRLPSVLEALGLDAGAVIFSLLGISLARLGRRAVVERVLVIACAFGSCGMNALNANLGSPRSVAVWALPPVLFALTSDRLVAVVRRAALGRLADDESQRSARRLFGTGLLYAARFTVAPRSTARGARQALLNATPLPELTSSAPAQLPAASPAALATTSRPTRQRGINQGDHRVKGQPRTTKAEQLLTRAGERHDLATVPLTEVSSIASAIAAEIGLHPGTARRVLLRHVRQLQEQR